jgi:hypothetical protein
MARGVDRRVASCVDSVTLKLRSRRWKPTPVEADEDNREPYGD